MVSTTTSKKDRTGITLPVSLLKKIDNKRGDIPRSKYIRRAIESLSNEIKGEIERK
jgi:metal-responsive CopG/Arc/MetJ family transcriptional regulator